MKNIEIKTSRYHALNETERTSIDQFVHLCWGEQEEGSVHRNDFPVQSFGLFVHGTMTAYAGVILIDTMIDEQRLLVGALSCFCVHPSYRHHGCGLSLFDHLTRRMVERSQIDLGLFTCAEHMRPFTFFRAAGSVQTGISMRITMRAIRARRWDFLFSSYLFRRVVIRLCA